MTGIYWFGKFIPFYGIMIASGILLAGLSAYPSIRHRKLSFDNGLLLAAYGLCGGMTGAKLLYLITIWNQIQWDRMLELSYLNELLQSGYVFYGGLVGGILFIFLGGRIHKLPVSSYLESCIFCIPLAHGFGRIGCYLVGCCYGIPYSGIGSIIYHAPSFAPTEIPLFPVQLVEALLNFSLALFLFVWVWKKNTTYSGICIYLSTYAVYRFLLEQFFRNDAERGKFLFFYTSQWICILVLLSVFLFLLYKKEDHNPLYRI